MKYRKNSGGVILSYTIIRRIALVYISLPIFCFFLGWLKWYWAALSCIALSVCLLTSWKKAEHEINRLGESQFAISKRAFISIVLISAAFSFLCGIGRFWAQSNDYPCRNAIFRDLILYDWPVYYDKFSGALSYYIAIWLPAALPGKIVCLLGGSAKTAFLVGNISLFVYFVIGLTIMFLLIARCCNAEKNWQIYLLVFGFFFFSGMDAVAPQYEDWFLHFEWWSGLFQYSSMTTCICWVFNQTLIPWICIALILNEKTVSDYVLIGMSCLLSGPFPFFGFFFYSIVNGVKRLVDMTRIKEGKSFVKEVFSISNACSALILFPIIGSYLLSNSAFDSFDSGGPIFEASSWVSFQFVLYFLFLMIEFGVFAILIIGDNKKNYLFYATLIQLIAYPLFHLGDNSDFTMRASIPSLFVMYVLCYQYLLKHVGGYVRYKNAKRNVEFKKQHIPLLLLVICLIIGAVTPSAELLRGCFQVCRRGIDDPITDGVVTLNQESNPVNDNLWPPRAYVALNLDEQLFFKYFAREQE